MREEELDELLRKLGLSNKERLGANFEAVVWGNIRAKNDRESWAFYTVVTALLRPSWILSALVLAGLVGIGTGAMTQQKQGEDQFLGLNVFSAQSPELPSTLLHQTK